MFLCCFLAFPLSFFVVNLIQVDLGWVGMADFDSLLDEVLQKLPQLNLDQLTECCTQLAIDVPEAKKGKRLLSDLWF